MKRIWIILLAFSMMLCACTNNSETKVNSSGLSEEGIEFGFGVAKNELPSDLTIENQKFFDKFGALAYDSETKEKVLYLTFDCGYENGYTGPVLDVLKQKKVPAAFFVTLHYVKDENGALMTKRMIEEGHVIGNHSATHKIFPDITRDEMKKEIETLDKYLIDIFGYSSKYFRFPTGEYSESSLDLVSSLGYMSVFWSVSYADYDVNNQMENKKALEKLSSRIHPGAVILLHSVSKTNSEILGEFIDYAREKGYEFRELPKK